MSEQNVENQENPLADSFKKQAVLLSSRIFHQSTSPHGNKMRGKGITRKNKELSKSKLRIQKNSRKINRNKKRHHMTRKEKKAR